MTVSIHSASSFSRRFCVAAAVITASVLGGAAAHHQAAPATVSTNADCVIVLPLPAPVGSTGVVVTGPGTGCSGVHGWD